MATIEEAQQAIIDRIEVLAKEESTSATDVLHLAEASLHLRGLRSRAEARTVE